MITVEQCCRYLELKDYPIVVNKKLKEKFRDKKVFEDYAIKLFKTVKPDAHPLHLQTLIQVKWCEVMKTVGSSHYYREKKTDYKEAIQRIKTRLEDDKVGWVTHDLLPNGWKVRSKDRVQGDGQLYFQSPHIDMFKTNKAVLEFITSQRDTYSQEDIDKIKTFIKERQKSKNEMVREMKKITEEKDEEMIEMVRDEEVGEEDIHSSQEIELSRKKEEDKEDDIPSSPKFEPPRKRRKSNNTTKSQEKGDCSLCLRNMTTKSLIKHAETCWGGMKTRS